MWLVKTGSFLDTQKDVQNAKEERYCLWSIEVI